MLRFRASITIRDGMSARFESICDELFSAIRANEPGCRFAAYGPGKGPHQYEFLEVYRDEAAYDAHRSSAHFMRLGPELIACCAQPPTVSRMDD